MSAVLRELAPPVDHPVVTDADGRFRVSLPPMTCTLQVHGHPDARQRLGEPFGFEGTTVRDVEVRVPR